MVQGVDSQPYERPDFQSARLTIQVNHSPIPRKIRKKTERTSFAPAPPPPPTWIVVATTLLVRGGPAVEVDHPRDRRLTHAAERHLVAGEHDAVGLRPVVAARL